MDLILLVKIVRMESDIRTAQAELDEVGVIAENKRGTPIPNPLLSIIDTRERRQLAVIRSMSLNQTASDLRTLNGFAKLETKARSAIARVGADDLIARPQSSYIRRQSSNTRDKKLITTLLFRYSSKPTAD